MVTLNHKKPKDYGWYGAGFAAYKGSELHECPPIKDQEGWFEFLDGFNHAYADYSIGSDLTFEQELSGILGSLLYDVIEDFLKAWDQRRRDRHRQ